MGSIILLGAWCPVTIAPRSLHKVKPSTQATITFTACCRNTALTHLMCPLFTTLPSKTLNFLPCGGAECGIFCPGTADGNGNNNGNGNGTGNGNGNGNGNGDGGGSSGSPNNIPDDGSEIWFENILAMFCRILGNKTMQVSIIAFCLGSLLLFSQGHIPAFAQVQKSQAAKEEKWSDFVWEIRSGRWTRLRMDYEKDEFKEEVANISEEKATKLLDMNMEANEPSSTADNSNLEVRHRYKVVRLKFADGVLQLVELVKQVMLPDGYPASVTEDYMEYTLWRMAQVLASQINGVLTTQALLYAIGLGKGAIPVAASVNWVLRDGIGYMSKIFLSKYGRHFDVHPKGWRLFSDLLEDVSNGLELLTPAVPHLFGVLGAASGAGKSAAGLIQSATRNCFYAGFAAQHNYAEVIAKGEAQGMLSRSLGIALGIGISKYVGASGPLLVLTFAAVTTLHVLCNLKSYEAVQLHTLNTYRASLLMLEYLKTGNVLAVKDVNYVEPIFPNMDAVKISSKSQLGSRYISNEAKCAAAYIQNHLNLGCSLMDVTPNGRIDELLALYDREKYLLAFSERRFMVVLKETSGSKDLLRAMLQVAYLYHLRESNLAISESKLLEVSYRKMDNTFSELKQALSSAGWLVDGLVARPGPYRFAGGTV